MGCVGRQLLHHLQTFLLEVVDEFLDSILCQGSVKSVVFAMG